MYDTPAITEAVYRIILTPIGSIPFACLIVLTLGYVFGDHPIIAETALGLLVVALLTGLPFAAAVRRLSGQSRRAGSTTTATLEEGLTNMLAVQSLGGQARERTRFDADSWAAFGRHRRLVAVGMVAFVAALVPSLLLIGRVMAYVGNLVIGGRISLGDFGLLLSYFLFLGFACIDLGALWIRIQASAAGLNRVFFLMDQPLEADRPGTVDLGRPRARVALEHVSFAHPGRPPVLNDVSAEFPVGWVTAIVGPAGAGKTTLAYLVPRFLEPSAGRVTFDGVDVAGAFLAAVRAQVAFLFQETAVFDATVEENIRIGSPDASDAEVRRAAEMAGADEFIHRLPAGYGTRLGAAGGRLSVGQKQRLAVARALVRDAPILVLDEPTSALDPETERRLLSALAAVARDRAVVVITYRLTVVRDAAQILFLDGGRILERGTHAELMAHPAGAYRRFVELQNATRDPVSGG